VGGSGPGGRGPRERRHAPRHGVADTQPHGDLRSQPGHPAPYAVSGHSFARADHGAASRVSLVTPSELLHVARVLCELLVERDLTGLPFRGRARDPNLLDPDTSLRLGNLRVGLHQSLSIRITEIEIERPDLKDADPYVVQVGRVRDERRGKLTREGYRLEEALSFVLAQLPERSLHAVHEEALDPGQHLIVVAGRGLACVCDNEPNRVGDHDAHLAEDPGLHLLAGQGIDHVPDRSTERHSAHGSGRHEEDLRDVDLAARVLGDKKVEKWYVLRFERHSSGREDSDDPPISEEHRTLVAVDGELGMHGDVLVRVLVDDEVLAVVRTSDHQLAHAIADKIENAHGSAFPVLHNRVPHAKSPEPLRRDRPLTADTPIDVSQLSALARKVLDASAPAPLRQMAAKGIAPGLRPGEALTVIVLYSESDDAEIARVAQTTLSALPAPLLKAALSEVLPPSVLTILALAYCTHAAVAEKILMHDGLPLEAVEQMAQRASEEVAELVATNEERMLAHPPIIEKLYMNKSTRMSTADRVLELAVRNHIELHGIPAYREAAAAIAQELIVEASVEPTPDDVHFKDTEIAANQLPCDPSVEDTHRIDETSGTEVVEDRFQPLHQRLATMTVSQKIRRAMLGTATERLILVRDSNRLVAEAAVKSPSIQENEIARISASRSVCEDVLRTIALDREWTRSHQVKVNLVQNPRTPFVFAAKLIPHLREHELKMLAKNKNVPGAVAVAAKQQLSRRRVEE